MKDFVFSYSNSYADGYDVSLPGKLIRRLTVQSFKTFCNKWPDFAVATLQTPTYCLKQLRKNSVATFNSRNLRTLTSPLLKLHHYF